MPRMYNIAAPDEMCILVLQMFKLWYCADADMLERRNYYRLQNTGELESGGWRARCCGFRYTGFVCCLPLRPGSAQASAVPVCTPPLPCLQARGCSVCKGRHTWGGRCRWGASCNPQCRPCRLPALWGSIPAVTGQGPACIATAAHPDNPTAHFLSFCYCRPLPATAAQSILGRCQRRIGSWVGSSVVHLGDHNVPNALMYVRPAPLSVALSMPGCARQLPVLPVLLALVLDRRMRQRQHFVMHPVSALNPLPHSLCLLPAGSSTSTRRYHASSRLWCWCWRRWVQQGGRGWWRGTGGRAVHVLHV